MINIQLLKDLLHKKCRGNYNALAQETGVSATVLYKFLNGEASVGLKNRNRLSEYIAANAE